MATQHVFSRIGQAFQEGPLHHLHKPDTWPQAIRMLVIALCAAGIFIVGNIIWNEPLHLELRSIKQQVQQLESQLAHRQAKVKQLPELRNTYQKQFSRLSNEEAYFTPKSAQNDLDTWLAAIHQYSLKHKLAFSFFKPVQTDTKNNVLDEVTIELRTEADFVNLIAFCKDIASRSTIGLGNFSFVNLTNMPPNNALNKDLHKLSEFSETDTASPNKPLSLDMQLHVITLKKEWRDVLLKLPPPQQNLSKTIGKTALPSQLTPTLETSNRFFHKNPFAAQEPEGETSIEKLASINQSPPPTLIFGDASLNDIQFVGVLKDAQTRVALLKIGSEIRTASQGQSIGRTWAQILHILDDHIILEETRGQNKKNHSKNHGKQPPQHKRILLNTH